MKQQTLPAEPSQLCPQCGLTQVSFFIIESNKHLCEKCAVNEIYKKHESYEKIMEKVWNKVKNIMKLR